MGQVLKITGGAACECDEGYLAIYSPDGKRIEGYVRTGLAEHDCDYIKWRNSKIPEAEAICRRRGLPPEGFSFLKAMEELCKDPNQRPFISESRTGLGLSNRRR